MITVYDHFLKTASQEDIEEVEKYQQWINDGTAWKMEGSVGRSAMALLRSGHCELGEKGHKDYWGNYVPSKYEVKPGTKGAPLSTREYLD